MRKYVSDLGFKSLGDKFSHQKKWKKTIFEVYKDAEVPIDWTNELKKHCENIKIDFFSTPYDLEMVDHLDQYVPAYKIGSGDLAWHEMIKKAKSSGADYAKFQSWKVSRLKSGEWDIDGRREIYENAELSKEKHLFLILKNCENLF